MIELREEFGQELANAITLIGTKTSCLAFNKRRHYTVHHKRLGKDLHYDQVMHHYDPEKLATEIERRNTNCFHKSESKRWKWHGEYESICERLRTMKTEEK